MQALSPAVAPRALWVAAHHASLPRRLPGNWTHLLGMVDALLQRGLTDVSSKVHLLHLPICPASTNRRSAAFVQQGTDPSRCSSHHQLGAPQALL